MIQLVLEFLIEFLIETFIQKSQKIENNDNNFFFCQRFFTQSLKKLISTNLAIFGFFPSK